MSAFTIPVFPDYYILLISYMDFLWKTCMIISVSDVISIYIQI